MSGFFNSLGLLILRVGFGGMMLVGHGLPKLMAYNELKDKIADPLGYIPAPYALMLLIGAEFTCSALVILGIATRLSAIPLVYALSLAAFVVHKADPLFLGQGVTAAKEPALVYVIAFAALIFTGAGMFSVDGLLFGKRSSPSA
ncbi:DoxX family protein [bacterium]|jgi:putative oxidoreductase|nr:DoxX family protein [bacterium]